MTFCFAHRLQTQCMYLILGFPQAPIGQTVTPCLCAQAANLLRVFHFEAPVRSPAGERPHQEV